MATDPATLRPGDWFVWHELRPPRYRVVEALADGSIVAEDERNLRLHGPGVVPPADVSVADRRFERVPPPEGFRRPLPDEVGTVILADVGVDFPVLARLVDEGSYGLKWAEVGSGEWLKPDDIHDWRLVDGIDTVRPENNGESR
jgi:hypothetical protein